MTDSTSADERASDAVDGETDSGRTAVVLVSHTLHRTVLRRFAKLEREIPPHHDAFFAYDATDATAETLGRARNAVGNRLLPFDRGRVTDTEYPDPWADPERQTIRGNFGLLYLHCARLAPGYSRYWFIEYDVVYTGEWTELFRTFENSAADVVGTTLGAVEHNPDWHWWQSLETTPDIDRSEWRRGFFPVVRLSRDVLARVDEGYRAGWSGHFEAVLPTLARHHGLELEDIGGDGPYVSDNNRNQFYVNTPGNDRLSPGTFVYRPVRSRPGVLPGKLWHPVKPAKGYI
jgi:hypothetical protein